MATLDTGYPILINFRQVRQKRLGMGYVASQWHILHNNASTGPVWPVLCYGGQLWSRMSCLNDLVHFKSVLRDLGLVYQVTECNALWDKIGRIWSGVAYNGNVFVTVSRFDRLVPCLSLYYLLWAALSLSVRLDYNNIKVPFKRESSQKRSIIIQYETLQPDMTNYGLIRDSISNSDQYSTGAPEKATYGLWLHLVAYTS